jgi:hypothetical protein
MTQYRYWKCGSVNHDTDECPEITERIGAPPGEPEVVRLDASKCTDEAVREWKKIQDFQSKYEDETFVADCLAFLAWAKVSS